MLDHFHLQFYIALADYKSLKSPFENNVEGNRKALTKLYIKAALHLLYSNIHYTVQTTNQNKSHF